jgi:hypothetical protein
MVDYFVEVNWSNLIRRQIVIQAQYIDVVNAGAYVLNFSVQWLDSSGEWKTSAWNSGNYPVGQNRKTPPLGEIGVPSDALAVTPYGHAVLGTSAQGTPFVGYAPNGQTATYNAVGTTFIGFALNLIG